MKNKFCFNANEIDKLSSRKSSLELEVQIEISPGVKTTIFLEKRNPMVADVLRNFMDNYKEETGIDSLESIDVFYLDRKLKILEKLDDFGFKYGGTLTLFKPQADDFHPARPSLRPILTKEGYETIPSM